MSVPDPFNRRFEVFGRDPQDLVSSINERARDLLKSYLGEGLEEAGRVILLQAPRAGYGKTSLLQSVANDLGDSHRFVRIQLTNGRTTDAAHVLEYVLQSLCEVVSEGSTLTKLDLLARQVLALGLEPLVASGEVPCQDRESALESLRDNPAQTFDFHYDGAVTAHWTKTNFEVLGPRLAAELARISGASLREASYWVELLFRFATTPPDNVERARLLFETIFRNDLQNQSSSTAEERLHGLLSLIGTVACPVLVVDDTEGLSTSPQDALTLASFLSNISQSCPRAISILSVNDDIWESSFLPNLPGGLADRLLAYQVTLEALTAEDVEDIIRARAGERAAEVLGKIDWSASASPLYPRRIVELASLAWAELEHSVSDAGVVKELESDIPVSASEVIADLPDLEDVSRGALHSGRPSAISSKGQEICLDKGLEEKVPVLTPEVPGVQSFESPFAPPVEVENNETPVEGKSLAGTGNSSGNPSPFEVVAPLTEEPPEGSPAPSDHEDSDAIHSSGPAGSAVDQRPRPFRPRSVDHGYQAVHPGSNEVSMQADVEKVEHEETVSFPARKDEEDPTRGEIEFSKLKPLSEKPEDLSHFEYSSSPIVAEPGRDTSFDEGERPPEPDFSAPGDTNENQPLAASAPEPEPHSSMDPGPMASPFEPQAMKPAESPFSAVLPESPPPKKNSEAPAESFEDMAPADDFSQVSPVRSVSDEVTQEENVNPFGTVPAPEPSPAEPAKEWWPGDPSSNDVQNVTGAPSPFVAVGTPPEPHSYPDRTEERAQPRPADSAASDREEVERMLRLLRERQDNH